MDSAKKKELVNSYKSKTVVGGIYSISCSGNGRTWIKSTVDLDSIKNRFKFALAIKSCPDPSMYSEWSEYGSDSFSLDILEELEKKELQTSKEFAEDIKALYEIWLEKSDSDSPDER